jgi:hypothetical protein
MKKIVIRNANEFDNEVDLLLMLKEELNTD